jgi:hypothetical protein
MRDNKDMDEGSAKTEKSGSLALQEPMLFAVEAELSRFPQPEDLQPCCSLSQQRYLHLFVARPLLGKGCESSDNPGKVRPAASKNE